MSDKFSFESILVPYNATSGAKRGLKAAIDFAEKVNGQITLITCIEPESVFSFFKKNKNRRIEQEKKIIETELKKIESQIKNLEKPLKFVVLQYSFAPSSVINFVEKNKIDIVIIGQTKLVGTEGTYHESMANYLTRSLKCPLLIIK